MLCLYLCYWSAYEVELGLNNMHLLELLAWLDSGRHLEGKLAVVAPSFWKIVSLESI